MYLKFSITYPYDLFLWFLLHNIGELRDFLLQSIIAIETMLKWALKENHFICALQGQPTRVARDQNCGTKCDFTDFQQVVFGNETAPLL